MKFTPTLPTFGSRIVSRLQFGAGVLLAGLGSAGAQTPAPQINVPYERILNAGKEPQNWLTYGGNYSAHRHSTLTQITPQNVANLKAIWTYQQSDTSKWEVTPIVVDGIMFISERPNIVTALDARSGRPLWNYRRPFPSDVPICCGTPNRGLAILNDSVYLLTFDAHLVCLDANTGRERWDTVVEDYHLGYSGTAAPIAVKDKIIVGIAGAEFGIRGFIDGYDAKTGKRVWRFWTIPGEGEPGNETWTDGKGAWKQGGGSTWVPGTFDPETNLIYWGTGNPAPDYNGDVRPGDNLYTCSEVALDVDTGKLKWYFQFTPHDVHDWDSCEVPVLFEAVINGRPRKLLGHANRNSFYYVLDRQTGQFISGTNFAKQSWAKGLDDSGRPILIPGKEPTPEGNLVYPGLGGSANWQPPSYNPATGVMFVAAREDYGQHFFKNDVPYTVGGHYENGGGRNVLGEEPFGVIKAMDAATGKPLWQFPMQTAGRSPILSTITGLVFSGTAEGEFFALDARTGKSLWSYNGGGLFYGGPVTFMVDGKQRVAIAIGAGLFVFGL